MGMTWNLGLQNPITLPSPSEMYGTGPDTVNENEKMNVKCNDNAQCARIFPFFPEKIEADIKYPFARDSELPDEIIIFPKEMQAMWHEKKECRRRNSIESKKKKKSPVPTYRRQQQWGSSSANISNIQSNQITTKNGELNGVWFLRKRDTFPNNRKIGCVSNVNSACLRFD